MIFNVYERKGVDTLHCIATLHHMKDVKEALNFFVHEYGDNYGKVICLPVDSTSFHLGYEEAHYA